MPLSRTNAGVLHLACRLFEPRELVRVLVGEGEEDWSEGEETVFGRNQWEKWVSEGYWASRQRWKMGTKE